MTFITFKIPLLEKPSDGARDQFYRALVKLAKSKFGNNFLDGISHWEEKDEHS